MSSAAPGRRCSVKRVACSVAAGFVVHRSGGGLSEGPRLSGLMALTRALGPSGPSAPKRRRWTIRDRRTNSPSRRNSPANSASGRSRGTPLAFAWPSLARPYEMREWTPIAAALLLCTGSSSRAKPGLAHRHCVGRGSPADRDVRAELHGATGDRGAARHVRTRAGALHPREGPWPTTREPRARRLVISNCRGG